jgi:hypothetical protein
VINKLFDLISLHGNEAFVAAVLAVLLLEDDTGNAAGFALLGGDILPGDRARDGVNCYIVFGIWLGQVI